jgi:hypothetical protein
MIVVDSRWPWAVESMSGYKYLYIVCSTRSARVIDILSPTKMTAFEQPN